MAGTEASENDPPPVPPPEPGAEECCRAGCDPCIYDLYFEELDRYERARKVWEERRSPGASVAAPAA